MRKEICTLFIAAVCCASFAQNKLVITSKTFIDGGTMPVETTGYGLDHSPDFHLEGIPDGTKTIAVIMDDLDVPFTARYTHWVLFNVPPLADIPSAFPAGEVIETPFHAIQGTGYGKHVYRGPKPPAFMKKPHRYEFTFYALSCELPLTASANGKEVLKAMEGNILATGSITGLYGNGNSNTQK